MTVLNSGVNIISANMDKNIEKIADTKRQMLKLKLQGSWLYTGGYLKEAKEMFKKADKLEKYANRLSDTSTV